MIESGQITTLMIVYGLGFAAVFLILFLLHVHAYRLRTILELNEIETHITRYEMMNQFAMVCFGVVSALIAFLVPPRLAGIAGYLYAGIGIYHFIAGWVMGTRGEKIVEKMKQVPPAADTGKAKAAAPASSKA
jgi:hypothetical protein